jgi:hypothetical protein
VDLAKDGGCSRLDYAPRPLNQLLDEFEQAGLSGPLLGRPDVQVRRDIESAECMGVDDPECHRDRLGREAKDDVLGEQRDDGVEQLAEWTLVSRGLVGLGICSCVVSSFGLS